MEHKTDLQDNFESSSSSNDMQRSSVDEYGSSARADEQEQAAPSSTTSKPEKTRIMAFLDAELDYQATSRKHALQTCRETLLSLVAASDDMGCLEWTTAMLAAAEGSFKDQDEASPSYSSEFADISEEVRIDVRSRIRAIWARQNAQEKSELRVLVRKIVSEYLQKRQELLDALDRDMEGLSARFTGAARHFELMDRQLRELRREARGFWLPRWDWPLCSSSKKLVTLATL